MRADHTPTPWVVDAHEPHYIHASDGTRFLVVGGDRNGHRPIDNCAFVVSAVNNHEALVAALNKLHSLVARMEGHLQQIEEWDDEWQDAIEASQAALENSE